MESDGTEQIYLHSLEKHNLTYRPFTGDGDSSSYFNMESIMLYGPYIVEKHECVNHVGCL